MDQDLFGSDWRVINKLGEGSFSEVFKVKCHKNQLYYAVKRLKKRYRSVEEVNRLSEIMTLRALQGHPNIIILHEVLYDSTYGYLALVFELLDKNLFELIRDNKKPFDENKSLLLIYQLLRALAYMHSKNLFHRDIKPENCMINENTFELKLADFGSTRQISDKSNFTEYVATRWYRAPECILTAGAYGPEVDIWAVGCVLFETLTAKPLFPGKHELDQISRIHNILGTPAGDLLVQFKQNPNNQMNYSFPQCKPQEFSSLLPKSSYLIIDLLSKLLIYNPSNRITAIEALKHPVFDFIRKFENPYQETDMLIPFSQFVLENFNNNLNYQSISNQQQSKISFVQQTIINQPKFDNNNILDLNQNNFSNLADTRKVAIERIKLYKEKFNINHINNEKNKNNLNPTIKFGAPKVFKPNINNFYQKPKAELIHPRIPLLIPKKLF